MAIFPGSAIPSAADAYTIDNSLRFEDGGPAYLSRTPGSAGDRKTWTWSSWVKRGNLGSQQNIFVFGAANADHVALGIKSTDDLAYSVIDGNVTTVEYVTTQVLRDPSAWYHIVVTGDTTPASPLFKVYINGEQVTAFDTSTNNASQDDEYAANNTVAHRIGARPFSSSLPLDGYLAEVYWIDGTALTPSSFGETNSTTNQWIPKDAVDDLTFGTNGFYQKYAGTELADSFTDSSADERTAVQHAITAYGNTHTDTSVKKIGTASAQLDGNGDYFSIPASSDWNRGTGDWTVEAWFQNSGGTSGTGYGNGIFPVFTVGVGWTGAFVSDWYIWYSFDSEDMSVLDVAGNQYDFAQVEGDWDDTDWHHIAFVRNGNDLKYYFDGTQTGSTADVTGESFGDSTNTVYIGRSQGGHEAWSGYWNGYQDEYRVSDTARYTGNFTPSTSAFTPDAYTLLLLHMDGANDGTVFRDAGPHTITANGGVTNTRAVKKVGDSSIKFDGTEDFLLSADSSDWDFCGSTSGGFTLEFWVRLEDHTGYNEIITRGSDPSTANPDENVWTVIHDHGNGLKFACYILNSTLVATGFGGEITDNDWHHVAVVRDGSDYEVFKDGTSVATTTDTDTGTLDGPLCIGGRRQTDGTIRFDFDGYLDEIRISDTARYTGSFAPSTTAFTTDSNTLLLLHSNWDGGLGADSSGNYNNFTPTNLAATDQMIDTPTNNFCTMNPVSPQVQPMSEGNLWVSTSVAESSSNTIGMESGKWYFEVLPDSTSFTLGIVNDPNIRLDTTSSHVVCAFNDGGTVSTPNSTEGSDTFSSGGSGDIYGFAIDADAKTLDVYQNNTKVIEVTSFTIDAPYFFSVDRNSGVTVNEKMNFGADSSFAGTVTAQGEQDSNGIGDFYYEPPSGYLALCTSNLPDPEIALPGDNFNTILYDDGAGAKTGVGFQPDLVWVKARGSGYDHKLTDAVRGVTKALVANDDSAETTDSTGLTAFGTDGFTVGADTDYCDTTGTGMVAWNWLGGNGTVSNAVGTITSTVSANTTAGFSICKYVGDGNGDATFGHGLSTSPDLVVIKNMDDTKRWMVWTPALGSSGGDCTYLLSWDTTAALYNVCEDTVRLSGTTMVQIGSSSGGSTFAWVNESGVDYISYCWNSIEGYSKVGTYTGNGVADGGPFIYTGFRPRFVMVKRTNSTGAWPMWDIERPGYNVTNDVLYSSNIDAETTGSGTSGSIVDLLSNGFKLMGTSGNSGEDGGTFIYYAVAQNPFKYSNAR